MQKSMINPTPIQASSSMPRSKRVTKSLRKASAIALATIVSHLSGFDANAASQTWTNAPVDSIWVNTNNWVARAIPGGLNLTGNTVNNDIATFNTPIPGSGIGGATLPILTDDATTIATRSRQIGGIVFDTIDCGAYVISSASPAAKDTASTPETGILNVSHNGSIQINSTVTKSQQILVPLYTRLPSSTAGIYNFVNNATDSAVTLYVASVTNDSANSRGTEFRLSGSNTGTNTVGALSAGTTTTGGNGLTKQGSGTWILAGANDFRAQTVVRITDGTLIAKDPAAFNGVTTGGVTVTNTGVLQIDAVTLSQISLNLHKGGNIRMNGSSSVNGVAVGAQTGTSATLSTTGANDVFTVGTGIATGAAVTGGAADTVLNTAGAGTLVFGQANTYIGKWSFGAKTNQLANSSALGTGANANVAAGAILDISPLGSFTPTTSGFGGSGTGTSVGTTAATVMGGSLDLSAKNINLTFTPVSTSGDTTHPALYIASGASLTLSGNTFFINNASGSALGVGTYRLIQQASGNITSLGGHVALVSGSGIASGATTEIVVTGGNVDLVVSIYVPKDLLWTGGQNATWNVNADANWLDGSTASVFHNSDVVTFNSIGSTNPSVSLSGTLAPAAVTIDTSANDYSFTGSGQIAGTTTLVKKSAGVLNLGTVNTYAGGTVVSNGTLRVAVDNAISSTGSGNVSVYGTGTLDLNNFANAINGLSGDGSVDIQGGGTSTLTIGNNDASGSFVGKIKNTSGTLAITKVGNGTQTLTASNSYSGATTLSAGTLVAANPNALGTGSDLTVNGGTLNMQTDLYVNTLAGSGGSIANNSTTTTNTLVTQAATATAYNGTIVDGSSGKVAVMVQNGGSLRLNGVNTYTGGTIVSEGGTLLIGGGGSVTGSVIASNGVTLGMPSGSSPPGNPSSITTADGATVTFTSGAEGNIWGGQFNGNATATNRFINNVSVSGSTGFSNFLGVVQFALTGGNFRFFTGGGVSGGDNTTFEFISGNVHTRDTQSIRLGAVQGGNSTCGIGGQGAVVATYLIGGKNTDSLFDGYFSGSNNLVKIGTGKLTFDGVATTTNTDNATYTNYLYGDSLVAFVGTTTISNGTLALVVPNNLSNSTSITLAGATAVLDASQMGYISNQLSIEDGVTPTNSLKIIDGILPVYAGQTLAGLGTVKGKVIADAGSTVSVGLPVGALTVTSNLVLNGSVFMDLNRTNSGATNDMISAFTISAGGTLTVSNLGPDLVTGDTFKLFNHPVTGFTAINLPTQNAAGTITYQWQTNITTDGTIKVLAGASPIATNPTNITFSVTGSTLSLSWPADHLGWKLQVQTNTLGTGLSSNWIDIPNSTAVTQTNLTVDPLNGAVFYRLIYTQP